MPRKRDRIRDFLFKRNTSPPPQYSSFQTANSSSSSAVLPVPDTSSRNQLTVLNESSVATVAWESVKTALALLKESSDWFPPLKAATGGLVALIDTVEVSKTNSSLSSHRLT